jgi:acyl-CoA thioesterase
MNVETKEQSKQWMHTHSPNKPKKSKQTSRKLMATAFWDRKGVLMVEFMQQGTTITLKELRKASYSEQKAWNADIRCSSPP